MAAAARRPPRRAAAETVPCWRRRARQAPRAARRRKCFVVGGAAQGGPAATSYAGEGEPNFAGDPEWEKYMQLDGDAGLELRVQVPAGPHVVGVSFVRELWEP